MNTATLKIAIEVDDKGSVKIRQVGDAAANAGRKGASGFSTMESSMGKANQTASVLSATIKGVGAVIAAAITAEMISRAVGLADAYTLAAGRLMLVTNSSAELAAVQDQLYALAQRTRTGFIDNVEVYARLAQNTKELNLQQGQLLTITETLNKAFIISGATEAERTSTMIQLSQAFSAGVLRGEEFNSVAEQGSRVMQLLADHTGKTRGELRAMAEDGQLTADVLVDAILTGAGDVNAEFGKMPMTVSQAGTMLKNTLGDLVNDANNATGATQGIAEAIAGIARAIDENKASIFAFFRDFTAAAGAASLGVEMMTEAGMSSIEEPLKRVGNSPVFKTLKSKISEIQAEIDRINGAPGLKAIKTENGDLALLTYQLEYYKKSLKDLTSSPYITGEATGKINVVTEAWQKHAFVMQGVQTVSQSASRLSAKALGELSKAYLQGEEAQRKYAAAVQQIERARFSNQLTDQQANAALAEAKKQLDKATGATAAHKKALGEQAKASREAAKLQKEHEREIASTLGRLLPLRKATQDYTESLTNLEIAKAAGTITDAEYRLGLEHLNREMEDAKKQADSYAQSMRDAERATKESELARASIKLETAIATGQITEGSALPFQVDLLKQRLALQLDHLATLKKSTPEEISAYNSQAEAVARLNLELAEKERSLRLTDGWEAAKQGFKDFADSAINNGESIRQATEQAMASMTDVLVDFVRTGKFEFSSLVDSILADLARIAVEQAITGPLAAGLGGVLGGLFGGGATAAGSTVSSNFSVDAVFGSYHTGGIVGSEGGSRAGVNPIIFNGAPRYHTGLLPDEYPAILKKGEGVFTEGQMAALGGGRGTQVVVNIIEAPGKGGQQQQRVENGVDMLDVFVEKVTSKLASDINLGNGIFPASLESTYNMSRAVR